MNKNKKPYVNFPEFQYVLRGVAQFPKLLRPDTTYKAEGEYAVRILYPEDDASAVELMERLEQLRDETVAFMKSSGEFEKQLKATKGEVKLANLPFRIDVDKDGEPTGFIAFNSKKPGSYKNEDGTLVPSSLPVYDKQGLAWSPALEIGGGSILQVSVFFRGFFSPALGAGVSGKLRAVKVDQHKARYNKNDPTTFGFEMDDAPPISDFDDEAKQIAPSSADGDY